MKLDIGCGKNKREGFIGCDSIAFEGVDKVFNVGNEVWPFEDNSVEEINCSHVLEHLTNLNDKWERVHFFNEVYRVLQPGGKATVAFPHWCSNRYYGDPTHKEPFSEMGFYYLSKEWRKAQAPHSDSEFNKNGYSCDLQASWGYSYDPQLNLKSQDYMQFALANFKEVIYDIVATLVKPAIKEE